jgi:hypothetical protein
MTSATGAVLTAAIALPLAAPAAVSTTPTLPWFGTNGYLP